ncbi:hypothetical protein [Chryseolinea lacunae]|uniref:Uncharacterized protein n=1 Tax=Chryseolinea lacunae TaxID=2801331 RepID=A0ABS1KUP8_9BACT|nr:hypothetical protein [Chryseolinea lacunae]MBL0743191.1 hypothetical protein [Chryseolinea lacunae]
MIKVLEFFCLDTDHEHIHRIIMSAFDQPCVVPPHKARQKVAVAAAKADEMFIPNKVTYLSEQSRVNNVTFRPARQPDERIKFVMDIAKSPVIEFRAPYQRSDLVFVAGAFVLPSFEAELKTQFDTLQRLLTKNFLLHSDLNLYVSHRITLNTARFFFDNRVHAFAPHELVTYAPMGIPKH